MYRTSLPSTPWPKLPYISQCSKTVRTCTHKFKETLIWYTILKNSSFNCIQAAISGLEATTPKFDSRGPGSIPWTGNGFLIFFSKFNFFQEVLWLSGKFRSRRAFFKWKFMAKTIAGCICIWWPLAASPEKFPYFYYIKWRIQHFSSPFFGLLLSFKGH